MRDELVNAVRRPLGVYFRNRLGVPLGALVEKRHLEEYGRTDITFHKIDDENYLMDFSVG